MTETASQLTAINSTSSAILNVAGAGSGKTTTIVNRIARLIKEGTNPESILCLTFTRKAANELKQRLQVKIGDVARRIWTGTFHSVSYRILAKWGERIGYKTTGGQAIAVVPPDEATEIFDGVVELYGWKGAKKALADAKQTLAHDGKWSEDPNIVRIIREYWSILRACNAVDFDQLLLEVHRLFQECPDALQAHKNRIEHIFVDEYQDTDHQQYHLHEVISPKNLYAVGDPDQAIYGWRGADVGIILDFEKAHEGAEIIKLEECFRCGTPIVKAANRLIGHNEDRIEKTLIPVIDGGEIEVLKGGPELIARLLKDEVEFNSPDQVAVIGRTHDTLDVCLEACQNKDIPVFKVGAKTREIEGSKGWKNFHAAVRLALNPSDDLAFHRRGAYLLRIELSEKDALKNRAISAGTGVWAQYIKENPKNIISQLRFAPEFQSVRALAMLWKKTDDSLGQAFIDELGETCPNLTPAQWLEYLAGKDMHTELEKGSKGKVTFLTAHAAKGLEWDVVYVIGFDQGEFPKQKSIREKRLEEERRLSYVAFTRARNRLVLVHEKEPSQFVKEAGL
ncbi:MAG: ATP-dependent helicase [Candidatus Riflebacteria bacterium]|nr:ATP-dependent helicase [Candidatus Riflebacteria bacterium]